MAFEVISTDQVDRVAIVTLNRPEVLNALNLNLVRELDQFLTEAEADDGIGAVIITGAGERAFSAGADIHENREFTQEQRDEGAAERAQYTWHMTTCTKPVIGAINGLCYVAAPLWQPAWTSSSAARRAASASSPSTTDSSTPPGACRRWWAGARPRNCSTAGARCSPTRPTLGLLNHLVPSENLMEKTIEVAAGIAKNRPDGVNNIKQLLIEHTGNSLEQQFWAEIEGRQGRFRGLTVEEGFADFLNRKGRKPAVS